MKVNSLNNRDVSFNGFIDSKALKSILGFAERNGALFTASTAFVFSAGVRSAAICAAPKTDKENKKVALAKSLTSSILEMGITLLISAPIVKGIEAITKNPKIYLKPETIKNLQNNVKELQDSKIYTLATQALKLGISVAIAIPKSILTVLGMPFILNKLNNKTEKKQEKQENPTNLTFKGKDKNFIATQIGKLLDTKWMQNFSNKYKDSNFPMHISALRDSVATATFIKGISKSNKIEEERKLPIMYNSLISTSLSIASTYLVDHLLEEPAQRFIEKFQKANKNDPNLNRYIKGFKIAKPAFIAATIYYMIIPFVSTFFADRADKKQALKFMHNSNKN